VVEVFKPEFPDGLLVLPEYYAARWPPTFTRWCGRGDLNPHAFRRHPLKMVCLPIPPLPLRVNLPSEQLVDRIRLGVYVAHARSYVLVARHVLQCKWVAVVCRFGQEPMPQGVQPGVPMRLYLSTHTLDLVLHNQPLLFPQGRHWL
jgi:hypothetical protein